MQDRLRVVEQIWKWLPNESKAKEEIALMREYDYAIVNDQVPLAAERVKRVTEAEHLWTVSLLLPGDAAKISNYW